jgi:hypothetical protein
MAFNMQPQYFAKRSLDTSGVSPDFRPQQPKNKRRMQKSTEVAYGSTPTIDFAFIDRKILEVESLLQELYQLREYFEQKNSNSDKIPSYFS